MAAKRAIQWERILDPPKTEPHASGLEGLQDYDPDYAHDVACELYPWVESYFRIKVEGHKNLPSDPFLGVGNHGGGFMVPESVAWMMHYATLGRKPNMLGLVHEFYFDLGHAPIAAAARKAGAIKANFDTAHRALDNGFALQVYPGGDHDTCKTFNERNLITFYGRKGYIRLALQSGVPIVPIVAIGGHETMFVLWDGEPVARALRLDKIFKLQVFPLQVTFPWGLQFGLPLPHLPLPAQITISILPPIHLNQYSPQDAKDPYVLAEIDREVRMHMQFELNRLAEGRIPIIGKV
jgi:1-acyl-sn-glycerol-3-phosphate acyltransferase